jgi:hypothetical protein
VAIVREAVGIVFIGLALIGIAIALGTAWLIDRAYEALTA